MKVRLTEDAHPVHAKAGTIGELERIGSAQRFTPEGGSPIWIGKVQHEPLVYRTVNAPRQRHREK